MHEEKLKRLTKNQRVVYDKIKSYIGLTGVSPTLDELRQMLSLHSLNAVSQSLDILERHGLITRQRYQYRSIELTTAELGASRGPVVLPVIASAGCDAMSVFAQQAFDEYLAVDRSHIPLGKRIQTLVVFRAIGDSMDAAGIADGDCVLVERTDAVNSGDRVVAAIDGMAVIKRLRRTADDTLILEPASRDPSYERIIMLDNSRIFGKVLNVIKMDDDDEYVIEYTSGRREVY